MSSNLTGFVYKLGPVDQFFCPFFKRQLLAMLCTVKVNIFLSYECNCKC